MAELNVEQIIALVGFLLIIAGLGLNVLKKVKRYSIEYNGLNLAGFLLLLWYAFSINDIVFEAVFGAWGLISLFFLIKRIVDKDPTHEIEDLDVESRNWKYK